MPMNNRELSSHEHLPWTMLARLGGTREARRAINLPFLRLGSSNIRPKSQLQSRNYNNAAEQVLDLALYLPHELFQTVHSIGFSWATALPISAFLVRACVYCPLFAIPSHMRNRRRVEALPLKEGWTHAGQISMKNDLPPEKLKDRTELRRLSDRRAKLRHLAVDKDFKIGLLANFRPLLQFPIFYTFAETIRRMAGAQSSLLALIVQHMPGNTERLDGRESMLESNIQNNAFLEPSMASEGILWFENLTVADPTHNLSFILSATTFGHLWWRSRNTQSIRLKALRVLLLSGAVLIAPLTLNMPSAVLLFWLSSTVGAILQGIVLDLLSPLPKPIRKCSRLSSYEQPKGEDKFKMHL